MLLLEPDSSWGGDDPRLLSLVFSAALSGAEPVLFFFGAVPLEPEVGEGFLFHGFILLLPCCCCGCTCIFCDCVPPPGALEVGEFLESFFLGEVGALLPDATLSGGELAEGASSPLSLVEVVEVVLFFGAGCCAVCFSTVIFSLVTLSVGLVVEVLLFTAFRLSVLTPAML